MSKQQREKKTPERKPIKWTEVHHAVQSIADPRTGKLMQKVHQRVSP